MIIGIGTDLIEISRIKNTRRNKTVERIFSEEEILRDEKGKPYAVLHGNAQKKFEELGGKTIHLSITDTKELVSAFAVLEG